MGDGASFTSTTTDPLLSVTGGSVTTKQSVVRIGLSNTYSGGSWVDTDSQGAVSATLAGPLLKGTDTTITATSSVLLIRDRSTFKSTTTAPLIQLGGAAGSTLTLGGPEADPTDPNYGHQANSRMLGIVPALTAPFAASAELAGPVLKAENTTISTTDTIVSMFGKTGASATLTSHTPEPLVQLTGGSVTMAGDVLSPLAEPRGDHDNDQRALPGNVVPGPRGSGNLHASGPRRRDACRPPAQRDRHDDFCAESFPEHRKQLTTHQHRNGSTCPVDGQPADDRGHRDVYAFRG